MLILEEPYVSEMLINYLAAEQIPVLRNHFSEQVNQNGNLNLIAEVDFIKQYQSSKKIYTISEYALDWVLSKLNDADLNRQINLLKNKAAFRQAIQPLYPDFIFQEIPYAELFSFNVSNVQFPLVLKPSVGFLSAGVYTILDENDWVNALVEIRQNFKNLAGKFPDAVVGDNTFILESYIGGKEFAVDLYFRDKKPVIINIFEHPFSSEKDVSDRLYTTSKKVFDDYLQPFTEHISHLNSALNLSNIPIHIELRADGANIIPIEINPLRFAGMCLNEINFHITGKHPLHYYRSNAAPDYETMWNGKEDETFSFSIIEKSAGTDKIDINSIKSIYSNILEWRAVDNPQLDIQAFVFSRTEDKKELERILKIK